jgi:hypothetical protein
VVIGCAKEVRLLVDIGVSSDLPRHDALTSCSGNFGWVRDSLCVTASLNTSEEDMRTAMRGIRRLEQYGQRGSGSQ